MQQTTVHPCFHMAAVWFSRPGHHGHNTGLENAAALLEMPWANAHPEGANGRQRLVPPSHERLISEVVGVAVTYADAGGPPITV